MQESLRIKLIKSIPTKYRDVRNPLGKNLTSRRFTFETVRDHYEGSTYECNNAYDIGTDIVNIIAGGYKLVVFNYSIIYSDKGGAIQNPKQYFARMFSQQLSLMFAENTVEAVEVTGDNAIFGDFTQHRIGFVRGAISVSAYYMENTACAPELITMHYNNPCVRLARMSNILVLRCSSLVCDESQNAASIYCIITNKLEYPPGKLTISKLVK
jgi:hypothetical protein